MKRSMRPWPAAARTSTASAQRHRGSSEIAKRHGDLRRPPAVSIAGRSEPVHSRTGRIIQPLVTLPPDALAPGSIHVQYRPRMSTTDPRAILNTAAGAIVSLDSNGRIDFPFQFDYFRIRIT